jgi:tetratricopeptide (TPR) repeat protein
MRLLNPLKISSILAIAVLFHGCATAPNRGNNDAVAGDFSDDSLEVLFATEFPVASKDEALAKAALAYRDGEFDKSQFYLVRALRFDITDVNVLTQIGDLHVIQGNSVLAARAFKFALQQDSQHAKSLQGLGLLYFRAGNDDKARELLERAIAGSPDLWRAFNALGVIADRNRNFDLALSYYDTALEIQPLSDSILINRGYSKYLNENYRDAAVDFYEVATRSGNARAWRNLGMVYARQGWYEDALESYLEVIDVSEAHNEIGAIAMRNGDTEAADYFLNEAIRLSPTYYASAEKNLAELQRSNSIRSLN